MYGSMLSLDLIAITAAASLHFPNSLSLIQTFRYIGPVILDAIIFATRRNENIQVSGKREAQKDREHDDMRQNKPKNVRRVVAEGIEFRIAEREDDGEDRCRDVAEEKGPKRSCGKYQ